MTGCPWRLSGERCAGSSPGQGTGLQPPWLWAVLKLSVKGGTSREGYQQVQDDDGGRIHDARTGDGAAGVVG